MFVATIAGVCTIAICCMTDFAFGIVIAVKDKEVIVGKGGWHPLRSAVALITVALDLPVIFVIRSSVAGSTFVLSIWQEIGMIKGGNGFPCIEIMAILTCRCNLFMECVGGHAVATNAIVDDHFINQQVVKPTNG